MSAFGLETFIADLRRQRVAVGAPEIARLRQVFARAPDLEKAELREVFVAILAREAAQQVPIRAQFERWWSTLEAETERTAGAPLPLPEPVPPRPPLPDPPPEAERARWTDWLAAAAFVALLGAAAIIGWRAPGAAPSPSPKPADAPAAVDESATGEAREIRFDDPVGFDFASDRNRPPIQVEVPGPPRFPWLEVCGATAAIAAALALLRAHRRKGLPPAPVPTPREHGPDFEPLFPAAPPAILTGDDRRGIVAALDRHVRDEPSRRIDIRRSVDATARDAGLPHVVPEPLVAGRELWFWTDQAAPPRADLAAFVAEVERALRETGLPFERARFVRTPDRLYFGARRETPLAALEAERAHARVYVFTDGRGIALALRSHPSETARLLLELSAWPHLAFVDLGVEPGDEAVGLAGLLQPYGLRCIGLAGAIEDLALGPAGRAADAEPASSREPREVRELAGAIAVSWDPLPLAAAQELNQRLGLGQSPFEVEAVAARVHSTRAEQLRRLSDLYGAERLDLRIGARLLGPARRALALYRERLSAKPLPPEAEQTVADHRRRLELALLGLAEDPELAARELHALALGSAPGVQEEVRGRLAHFTALEAPAATGDRPRAVLPWSWADLAGPARQRLAACGFAGLKPLRLRAAGRVAIAAGGLFGAALGLLGAGAIQTFGGARPMVRVPVDAWQHADIEIPKRYDGLRMAHAPWLHPLGPNRETGLWEFAVLGSSAQPEHRMVLVLLPGETFWMGAQKTDESGQNYDPDADADEEPVHQVAIAPFLLGKHEVTQEQWQRWTGTTQAAFDATRSEGYRSTRQGNRFPMVNVSWDDVHRALAAQRPAGVLRLPTESEWEYACRAGTTSPYSFSEAEGTLADFDWCDENSGKEAHEVGTRRPNRFGIWNMHGNVLEWCDDVYEPYSEGTKSAEPQPGSGAGRVIRGGSFRNAAGNARSACRWWISPDYRWNYLGFRLAASPSPHLVEGG